LARDRISNNDADYVREKRASQSHAGPTETVSKARGGIEMKKKLFDELVESLKQAGEIVRGERAPSREFYVDAAMIKQLRKSTKLSQAKFAALLRVEVSTLRNWEQGRREPTGPAKALIYAIRKDPTHVLKALAA
jgi:putative transcriptional regulator